jgi:hypothetical protein
MQPLSSINNLIEPCGKFLQGVPPIEVYRASIENEVG